VDNSTAHREMTEPTPGREYRGEPGPPRTSRSLSLRDRRRPC
jgi:hypothetical protein